MDDVNGGRLIFYDFGMMGRYVIDRRCQNSLSSNFSIRKISYIFFFQMNTLPGVLQY